MKLLIVIVNYRTPDLTVGCLRSLEAEQVAAIPARVVVADNASGDGSAQQIQGAIDAAGWSGWVSLLPLATNGGFACGNNAAIRPALNGEDRPQYVLLLNPDTVVRPGAIAALLHFLDAHPDAGIAGSALENPDGTLQRSAFRFPTLASEWEGALRLGLMSRLLWRYIVAPPPPPQACATGWVSGACFMVRRTVFERIGLLDEEYFMYFEEVDFCYRARQAGWPCWYVPTSRVVHLVGQASGLTLEQPTRRRPACWFDSRRRYFVKNHGRLYTVLADGLWLGGFVLWRLRRLVQRKPDTDPQRMLTDFVRHSVQWLKSPGRSRRKSAPVGGLPPWLQRGVRN